MICQFGGSTTFLVWGGWFLPWGGVKKCPMSSNQEGFHILSKTHDRGGNFTSRAKLTTVGGFQSFLVFSCSAHRLSQGGGAVEHSRGFVGGGRFFQIRLGV